MSRAAMFSPWLAMALAGVVTTASAQTPQTPAPKAQAPGAASAPQKPPPPPPATPPASRPTAAKPAVPAQTPVKAPAQAPGKTPTKAPTFHVNAYGIVGYQQFAAKESFGAIFGRSGKAVGGGGAQVWHRSGLFVQVDYSKYQDDGQRVFINNGAVFPLGIPLQLDLGLLDVGIGYKFVRKVKAPKPATPLKPAAPPTRRRDDAGALARWQATPATPALPKLAPRPPAKSVFRVTPYLGGGFGRVSYTETADFSQAGDTASESYSSYHVLGGVEIPLWKWIGVNVEGQYRWVPDGLGQSGVSAEFGEKNLGGPAFRVKLTVGR